MSGKHDKMYLDTGDYHHQQHSSKDLSVDFAS